MTYWKPAHLTLTTLDTPVTQEYLQKYFYYSPWDGMLVPRFPMRSYNITHRKGRAYVDCLLLRGYMYRLVWLYHEGVYPPKGFHIDHISGDKTNDRRSNLQVLEAKANIRKGNRSE